MKTRWTLGYLEKTYGVRGSKEWLAARCRKLTEETGVPWTWTHKHGEAVLEPWLDARAVEKIVPLPEEVSAVTRAYDLQRVEGYASLLDLHYQSGLPLKRLMEVVRYLLINGEAVPDVNRAGKVCYIRLQSYRRPRIGEER